MEGGKVRGRLNYQHQYQYQYEQQAKAKNIVENQNQNTSASGARMEWSREKTLNLINEYRKRRGLWDMTHEDYRKKEIKLNLLNEVSDSLGGNIAIHEIEKKFHTLRTQFHREIHRMKRKEPYNSKWFGFKNLQFLNSPMACRSSKRTLKSEITEEGIVTTKYIIREAPTRSSANIGKRIKMEPLTVQGNPIHYEVVVNGDTATAASTSRAHELEKLIEETTKDVDEDEEEAEEEPEVKPKMGAVSLEHHTYSAQLQSDGGGDISSSDHDPLTQMEAEEHLEENEDGIETIAMQGSEEEVSAYVQSASPNNNVEQHHHSHALPTRIIKIHRRDDSDYYDSQTQQTATGTHTLSVPAKRIYFETKHSPAVISSTPTAIVQSPLTISSDSGLKLSRQKLRHPHPAYQQQGTSCTSSALGGTLTSVSVQNANASSNTSSSSPDQLRDEFSTYGEYVANEMREISNRQILIALKHKINTALFEASMDEMEKRSQCSQK